MSKLMQALQAQIDKSIQKTIRKQVMPLKKALAELRRQIGQINRNMVKATGLKRRGAPAPESIRGEESEAHSRLSAGLLKKLRKKLKISQTELALLLDVSQPAVASWEQGRAKPRAAVRNAIVGLRKHTPKEIRDMLGQAGGSPVKKKRGRRPKSENQ